MVRGVTAVAQGDQVRGVIDSTGSTGNQVVDVGFAPLAFLSASPAHVCVAREYYGANGTPSLKLCLGRWRRIGPG
jgi:hypothetical protein